ncbi:hypothetical protein BDA99DRAFT_574560, partial [Phascolomyces articulosus]
MSFSYHICFMLYLWNKVVFSSWLLWIRIMGFRSKPLDMSVVPKVPPSLVLPAIPNG